MVFRIVAGVVARVVDRGDEVYQHHSSSWVVAGGHSSPMKGRGQVCSNEEQFAFLSHPIFRRKPNASHMYARITISHI
jgi:hypothetical protein